MLIFIIFLFHNVFLSNNQHINGPTISNPNCLVILHVDMNELLNLETPLIYIVYANDLNNLNFCLIIFFCFYFSLYF